MKKDMNDLKRLVYDLMQNEPQQETVVTEPTTSLVLRNLYNQEPGQFSPVSQSDNDQSPGRSYPGYRSSHRRVLFHRRKRKRTDPQST